MRMKSAPRTEDLERAEREQKLKDFIIANLDHLQQGADSILLVARAPNGPASRVLFQLTSELASRQLGAQIAFAGAVNASTGETWRFGFDPDFTHEIRLLRDPRFLDGHEQLVLGGRSLWFGDSMRREPDKRDAFTCFFDGDVAAANQARSTFQRLWSSGEPIYAHSLPDPVCPPKPEATEQPASAVPPNAIDTLEAWQVSTRH